MVTAYPNISQDYTFACIRTGAADLLKTSYSKSPTVSHIVTPHASLQQVAE